MSFRRKRRSKYEIALAILKQCPALKTQIMYGANLSFAQLNHYLSLLEEKKLITKEGKSFVITKKGKECREILEQIQNFL